jgi:glyoxylase-like metal-dependent hydrolase (beta-lactamase superfamily II)
MMSVVTITLPLCLRFVTRGILLAALAVASRSACAQQAPEEAAPADAISATNVVACGALRVHRLTVGTLSANCYLVCDTNRDAILIDPGACPASLARYIADQRARILAYVLTHSHLDHLSALDELAAALPADVAMHPEEGDWAFCEKNAWLPAYPRTREVAVTRPLRHQQAFRDGGLDYTVIHTPGHSPGSVCLWFPRESIVFTGDTLFAGTVGRTDLHRSSQLSLIRSLGVFLLMPPETAVFAGHGHPTTVANELATNPFMQDRPSSSKAAEQN